MSNIKKLMMSGAAGGGGLDVDEVFSTYVYTGNSSTQTINNGIDLTGEGGLTWFKCRNIGMLHNLFDTERGNTQRLDSSGTSEQSAQAAGRYPTYTSTGFTLGNDTGGDINYSGRDYVSWTFRKAPKFFDVVTYTGNGNSSRAIAHNLDSEVGFIIVKRTDASEDWVCYHRGILGSDDTNAWQYTLTLNGSNAKYHAEGAQGASWAQKPTTTHFYVDDFLARMNEDGATYVAYLFAHNDGDGGFGPDGDQDIIKCGSHTISTTDADEVVDLGFEAQWVLTKTVDTSNDWVLLDNMRGLTAADINDPYLRANTSNAEGLTSTPDAHAKGFTLKDSAGRDFIYIAIRRGPLAPPESGTEVFEPVYEHNRGTDPRFDSPFPVDMAIQYYTPGTSWYPRVHTRLTQGKILTTSGINSESSGSNAMFDYMDGWFDGTAAGQGFAHMWNRAPGFFDVVAYQGSYPGSQDISHNLGVAPEMIWVKARSAAAGWKVYHKDLNYQGVGDTSSLLFLEQSYDQDSSTNIWGTTSPTDTVFTVGNPNTNNSYSYIAYLFATLPGVSKVGSYTGNGSSQTIDCGFTSGARFVLIKSYNDSGDWQVFDTERGIVAGDDGRLLLNRTDAETNDDYIDPHSSGFSLPNHAFTNSNAQGQKYIFYAIA